jgi:hypothetical protein
MVEWSKDHVAAIGFLNFNFGLIGEILLNWRLGGALRWKVEDRRLGRVVSVMWKAGTSQVVAPACVG